MGESRIWFVFVRLFVMAYMRLVMGLFEACMIASSLGLDSPFNLRRSEA